ncbi:MAG: dCTP deaminase [Candidatus Micrarchaeota archaeon]|nr:dCTP deaminase [Candidatus Micrarchaeota archaeon]
MILSDFDLMNYLNSKRLKIEPFSREIVRENGIDFRLADEIAYHRKDLGDDFVMDPSNKEMIERAYDVRKKQETLVIGPREQVLLSTIEHVALPDDLVGVVELRSTWARHGFSMPPTIIDAGFNGNVTLEVINNAPYKIALKPNTRFAHIVFIKASNAVESSYSKGSYSGQMGVRLPKVISE